MLAPRGFFFFLVNQILVRVDSWYFCQTRILNPWNVQETIILLKIPIPTPASDPGGPVACIGHSKVFAFCVTAFWCSVFGVAALFFVVTDSKAPCSYVALCSIVLPSAVIAQSREVCDNGLFTVFGAELVR